MSLSLQQWHERYKQQARWTKNLRLYLYDRVGIRNMTKMLDIGCGTGVLLDELTQISTDSIFGVDIDFYSIKKVHESGLDATVIQGDGLNLPFSARSFDICFCHFVLMWVKNPVQMISEMVRITRPGGYVLALAEPDYGGRIDFPLELSIIGDWQITSLKEQGANPIIGRELRSLFSRTSLNNVEAGVLGGRWVKDEPLADFEVEWNVINSDLENFDLDKRPINELKELDRASRESLERILYVPTFYAIGEVKA